MNLNTPAIKSGALTLADLSEARKHSAGSIYRIDTHRPLPAGCDQQGRYETRPMPAEACTDVGADTRPAALSMAQHNRTAGRVALLLIAGPAAAAVVAVVAFIAQHMG